MYSRANTSAPERLDGLDEWLVSASLDGHVRVWDVRSMQVVRTIAAAQKLSPVLNLLAISWSSCDTFGPSDPAWTRAARGGAGGQTRASGQTWASGQESGQTRARGQESGLTSRNGHESGHTQGGGEESGPTLQVPRKLAQAVDTGALDVLCMRLTHREDSEDLRTSTSASLSLSLSARMSTRRPKRWLTQQLATNCTQLACLIPSVRHEEQLEHVELQLHETRMAACDLLRSTIHTFLHSSTP